MIYDAFDSMNSEYISLKFLCIGCNCLIETYKLKIPLPDFSSESIGKSVESRIESICCNKCEMKYEISIGSNYGGCGYLDIEHMSEELEKKVKIKEYEKYDEGYEYLKHLKSGYIDPFDKPYTFDAMVNDIKKDDESEDPFEEKEIIIQTIKENSVFRNNKKESNKKWVLLYSIKQQCFHGEFLEDYIRNNLKFIQEQNIEEDFKLLGIFNTNEECHNFAKALIDNNFISSDSSICNWVTKEEKNNYTGNGTGNTYKIDFEHSCSSNSNEYKIEIDTDYNFHLEKNNNKTILTIIGDWEIRELKDLLNITLK